MKVATNGIVVNESGKVLLIQRDDTKTFAPPGGSMDAGELPIENIAREVREETGLIVMPVRLVGVYFAPTKPEGMLNFVFRCIQRGGELATSDESLQVGYFWPKKLPKPMLELHRERLHNGLNHTGGPPYWREHRQTLRFHLMGSWLKWVVYPRMDRQRKAQGRSVFVPTPQWQVSTIIIIRRSDGKLFWRKEGSQWQLPSGTGQYMEPPWKTAVRQSQTDIGQPIHLSSLSGVYIHPEEPALNMVFVADFHSETALDGLWFHPGEAPANCLNEHKSYAAEAASAEEEVIIRHMDTAVHD